MTEGKKGFTLVELLVVLGIIGFLAAAILVAVDPVKRLQNSRNARRWSDVGLVMDAILNKQADDLSPYNGVASAPLVNHASNVQVIVSDDTGISCDDVNTRPGCNKTLDTSAGKGCVADLSDLTPAYIAAIPTDPKEAVCVPGSGCMTEGALPIGDRNSGYYIRRTSGNRIEIGACQPDQDAMISVRK
ncbi:hypothetical protein COY93_04755 [Candidatus Uhrbacteria bacterium CG_4_10_14_0_8_um_filter_58_22]|uniref:Type II secretion system protein n=1 Tax=Candidatus Uhrbacteria bacterium CG_4_10_14_0_8_um_filter_58_22 TaxID=1975029 RepID=A0A2M7Q9R3_9BACT|nr:MAG: hypothetical protein AUJ19_01095 [Parcubacteria group bacterium CG1_02_58_44]PIY61763.1 MAG: hypothetical protein COY93_04755 [Candidatus Uhrbacteria bacterium CG_4_10_14_0_8_um_filter_58_22]